MADDDGFVFDRFCPCLAIADCHCRANALKYRPPRGLQKAGRAA
jgi:hypothetical protein